MGRSVTTGFVHNPDPGVVQYRVAGVNLFRSPWVSLTVDTSDVEFATPPDITNLALTEPFTGPTLKIQWDSIVEEHRISFSVATVELHSVVVTGLSYELSPVAALGRSFDVEVYAIAPNRKVSTGSPLLSVSNPAPAVLSNLEVISLSGNAMVKFDWPADTDIAGISVWSDTTTGFTPSAANLVVDRSLDPVISVAVDQDSFIRVAAVDVWGDTGLNYSGEYSVTVTGVDLSEIEADIAALEGKFPITEVDISDDAISAPKIQANAIEADKIVSNAVVAGKIGALAVTAGTIAANAVTATEINVAQLSAIAADMGTLTAGTMKTTTGTDLRTEISSTGSWPLWIGAGTKNDANGRFYIKTDGTLVVRDAAGNVIIASGPTAVSYASSIDNVNQQWADVGGAGKPADNADVTSANPQAPGWLTSPVVWSGNKITSGNVTTYISGAAIDTAQIRDAAIENAKIKDLAVNTLKIAGQSVIIAQAATAGSKELTKKTYVEVIKKTIAITNAIASTRLIIQADMAIEAVKSTTYGGLMIQVRIKRNGSVRSTQITQITGHISGSRLYPRGIVTFFFMDSPGNGTWTYSIEVNAYDNDMTSGHCKRSSLLVTAGKR